MLRLLIRHLASRDDLIAMHAGQKLEIMNQLHCAMRRKVAAHFRLENPHWSEKRIYGEVARTMLNWSDDWADNETRLRVDEMITASYADDDGSGS